MVGGNGERRTMRLVAAYADACNFLVLEPDEIRVRLDALRRHCDEVGRDPHQIEITALDEVDLRPSREGTVVRLTKRLEASAATRPAD
jgi:alkanesulfonate monooxygenase SsuD/methylene tetrahydromethanopterin reductase-like flavin-dependent oxidoreductase (luciferase family)